MTEQKFSKGEAIRFGWDTMKSHFWLFVGFLIVAFLLQIVPGMIAEFVREQVPLLSFLINVASWVVSLVIQMGIIRFALRFCDNETGKFSDLFSCFPLFFKYLFAAILNGLILLGGTILLIIPGIIWAIQFQFFSYLIVDKGLGPIQALKKSSALTKGSKWNLFMFGGLLFLINVLGALCLLIGLFATVPLALVAAAFVYRKLLAEVEGIQKGALPQTG